MQNKTQVSTHVYVSICVYIWPKRTSLPGNSGSIAKMNIDFIQMPVNNWGPFGVHLVRHFVPERKNFKEAFGAQEMRE